MRRLPCLLIVAALTSCAWINEHDPAQTPTADYPCTPSGIVCSTKPLTCCGQGDTCGGTFSIRRLPGGLVLLHRIGRCPRGLPRRRDRPTDEGARQTVDAVISYGSTP